MEYTFLCALNPSHQADIISNYYDENLIRSPVFHRQLLKIWSFKKKPKRSLKRKRRMIRSQEDYALKPNEKKEQ